MSEHVRIRCPICGMLGWQSRLAKKWPFQVMIQHTTSRGRGKIRHVYSEPETEDGVFMLKVALADKMEACAAELRKEVRAEVKDLWKESIEGSDWKGAAAVTRAQYEATFESLDAPLVAGDSVGFGCAILPVSRTIRCATVDELEAYDSEYEEAQETDDSQLRMAPVFVGLGAYRSEAPETVAETVTELTPTQQVETSAKVVEEVIAKTVSTKGRSNTDVQKTRATIRYE